MRLVPVSLTADAFAPFGRVFELRDTALANQSFVASVENRRSHARLNVAVSRTRPTTLPQRVVALERHEHSSQLFVPMVASRWLVVVAPSNPMGDPIHCEMRAFVADMSKGVCYAPDVWHHPFVCLDAPAEMLMLRWDDDTAADTTWHRVPGAMEIELRAP
jgi:ureidoglycolate lyase